MEDEFRSFQEVEIPHSDYAVRFIQCCVVFIVRCDTQFGVLKCRSEMNLMTMVSYFGRPVNVGYGTIFPVPFIVEFTDAFDTPFRIISILSK